MAPSKKPATPDDIMPIGGIKALLKQVKKEGGKEISCAVGLPEGDKSEAVILLDKIMAPKGVRKHLIKEAKEVGLALDERSIRYGMATMDEADENILLVKVNKEPAGEALGKAVRKRVKSIFKEVVFSVDETLEGGAEEGQGVPGQEQQVGTAPPPPPPPPPQAPKPMDVAALTQRLADLIKRIPGVAGDDAARQAELGGLARQAGTLLKTGSPNNAALVMDDLEARLGGAAGEGALHGTLSAAKIEKSRMVWEAARGKIVTEVEALKKAVSDAFKGDEHEAAVTTALQQLDEIPRSLDARLITVLDSLKSEPDEAKRTQLTQEAQQILAGYQKFATASQVFPKLAGATPFGLTLTIAPTADATFKVLQSGLH